MVSAIEHLRQSSGPMPAWSEEARLRFEGAYAADIETWNGGTMNDDATTSLAEMREAEALAEKALAISEGGETPQELIDLARQLNDHLSPVREAADAARFCFAGQGCGGEG